MSEGETRDCPGCGHEIDPIDTGYAWIWECDEDCGWAGMMWKLYDPETFARVKEVQREVGRQAASRLAGEFRDGVLA